MHLPRTLSIALILVAVGAGAAFLWPGRKPVSPPVLKLEAVEPAGIFDDSGEMWLVTLSIQNPDDSLRRDNLLYVEDVAHPIQIRLTNAWASAEGSLRCALTPSRKHATSVLIPATVQTCRFSFRYCGAAWSFSRQPFKARLEWLAERLPFPVRAHFSYKFWRWAGFGPIPVPSRRWQQVTLELPVPPVTRQPAARRGLWTGKDHLRLLLSTNR